MAATLFLGFERAKRAVHCYKTTAGPQTKIRRKSWQRVLDTSDYRTNKIFCFVFRTKLPVFAR
ncbi:hypothetical protein GB937_003584 [Aspergillus fischeri]|nr:hypothetical protein GB937_003584 [Aspergillus fischeri]